MSEACTHDCSSCSANCASRGGEQQPESQYQKLNPMSRVKKVIAVVSGKGGVGKSLVTSLLAVQVRRDGQNAAILDADVTGPSIPQAFGLHGHVEGTDAGILPAMTKTGIPVISLNLLLENETDPVVWRGPVISGAVTQFWSEVIWHDVDVLFIDMPPGTGDVPLTVFQSIPVDGIVIVATPQELVGMIVEKAVRMAELMKVPVVGFVENMSYIACPDCGKRISVFGESHIGQLAEKYRVDSVSRLPIEPKLAAACDAGLIELFEGDWLTQLARKIEDM